MIIANILATIGGFLAKVKLSYWGLIGHAIYTISVIGGFYIYIFVDNAFKSDNYPITDESPALSETAIMIITSLPFLGLFSMGIYSVVLATRVEEELEEREK